MNTQTKTQIRDLTEKFVESFPSQKQASAHLRNVSEATLINVLKNNWSTISDEMWRSLGKQVGWSLRAPWNIVETLDFQTLVMYFDDAKIYGNVFGISAVPGSGKTFTAAWFARQKQNVFHVVCADYWNRKTFLVKILEAMGKDFQGFSISELMDTIIEAFLRLDSPLLILDEFDKLNDQAKCFFITLYNQLKGKCGIVIMGSHHLEKSIKRGVSYDRKGYAEIFSRIGKKWIRLNGSNKQEVAQICQANGVDNAFDVSEIFNECEGDLRRVERAVHKKMLLQQKA